MSLLGWIRESFPIDADVLREMSSEPIPNHLKKWWWALGGTPAYMFVVQMITGFMLVFYYVPDPATAYASVDYITNNVAFGWLIRSIHRWSANIMVAAVILHMMRVLFTRSFRRPRELNWMFGVTLFILTLFFWLHRILSRLRADVILGNAGWNRDCRSNSRNWCLDVGFPQRWSRHWTEYAHTVLHVPRDSTSSCDDGLGCGPHLFDPPTRRDAAEV